jgi:hypothetical protein
MTVASSGATAAAAAAAIANATKASGVLVRVPPEDFLRLVERGRDGVVVTARGGFFNRGYDYLTSYKGLAFFTRSPEPLTLCGEVELVTANRIWIPG